MRSADYIQETTVSIAGTLGDGAVTLTAITNRPRVSSALTATAATRYIIEDTVNKKFESGIGSFASNVLTRTLPQVTWDGTTYKNTGTVAPLQFGATPTSGNVIIRLGATAEASAALMDGRNYTVAGDATWRDFQFSGNYQSTGGAGVAGTLAADSEYYSYYRLDMAGQLAGIQWSVVTAVAATSMKLALYDIGNNGLPNNKIVDFVTTATIATGTKTDTATASWTPATGIFLTPGWYAFGYITNGAISLACNNGGSNIVGNSPLGRKNTYGNGNTIKNTGNYTTGLPAIASAGAAVMIDPSAAAAPHAMWFGMKIT